MSGRTTAGKAVYASAAVTAAAALLLASSGGCAECGGGAAPEPDAAQQVLLSPASEAFRVVPPDTFVVAFATSEGEFDVLVIRDWAPVGAYRFYNLVRNGFYDGVRFFRVIPGFMAQFGAHGVPAIQLAWADQQIPDDPVRHPNERGTVTFAMAGPDSRTTQLFINYGDNTRLDAEGFAPFGRVIRGMDVVDRLYGEYGETAPNGGGPDWGCMLAGGNTYLESRFDRLDWIQRAAITREARAAAPGDTATAR